MVKANGALVERERGSVGGDLVEALCAPAREAVGDFASLGWIEVEREAASEVLGDPPSPAACALAVPPFPCPFATEDLCRFAGRLHPVRAPFAALVLS